VTTRRQPWKLTIIRGGPGGAVPGTAGQAPSAAGHGQSPRWRATRAKLFPSGGAPSTHRPWRRRTCGALEPAVPRSRCFSGLGPAPESPSPAQSFFRPAGHHSFIALCHWMTGETAADCEHEARAVTARGCTVIVSVRLSRWEAVGVSREDGAEGSDLPQLSPSSVFALFQRAHRACGGNLDEGGAAWHSRHLPETRSMSCGRWPLPPRLANGFPGRSGQTIVQPWTKRQAVPAARRRRAGFDSPPNGTAALARALAGTCGAGVLFGSGPWTGCHRRGGAAG